MAGNAALLPANVNKSRRLTRVKCDAPATEVLSRGFIRPGKLSTRWSTIWMEAPFCR